jgi:hypothetical protein
MSARASTSSTIDIYPLRANLYPLSLSPRPHFVYEWRHEVDGKIREEASLEPIADAAKVPAAGWNISRAFNWRH